jgi:methyl-accepting chemotaxis protein
MRLHTDDQGIGGFVLVIVVAWALAAVLMLTGTLVSAQQIDERVAEITGLVSDIDDNTTAVELAGETGRIAADILAAAEPLSGQLDAVIDSAGSINTSAGSIFENAESINAAVRDINGSAGDIGRSVRSIHSRLSGTLTSVQSINAGIADINRRADTIIALARGIGADLTNVLAEVRLRDAGNDGIRGHARSIDCSFAVRAGGGGGGGC